MHVSMYMVMYVCMYMQVCILYLCNACTLCATKGYLFTQVLILFSLEHVTVSASLKTVLNVNGLSSVGLIITLNLKVNEIIYNAINRDYSLINLHKQL